MAGSQRTEIQRSGKIKRRGSAEKSLYPHQTQAIQCLNIIAGDLENFSTIVAIPTGGGKTLTAVWWLITNALDQGKKVLWLAHRHFLLTQAAKTFSNCAYKELMINNLSFRYRIVSGADSHDDANKISHDDQLLIVSKDSIWSNLKCLDEWLSGEDEVYFVIDEAHHSIALTYRAVIEYVEKKAANVKLIGLTATPFRSSEQEQGMLAQIYSDGVKDGKAVQGDIGIAYQISMKELIRQKILAAPVFEQYKTNCQASEQLGTNDLDSIQQRDKLPAGVANSLAENEQRNKMIVGVYDEKKGVYGQTIIFAINKRHAVNLATMLQGRGISADYIVSEIRDKDSGNIIGVKHNEEILEKYSRGEIQVLVNVDILTEGADLPKTQTVFLARPTVSKVKMTQMVGRAMRGTKAGGTEKAYIVSFVDKWMDYIAWTNPESLFDGDGEFPDSYAFGSKQRLLEISLSEVRAYAKILNGTIKMSDIAQLSVNRWIPTGTYEFSYEEKDGEERKCYVMVYDNAKKAYQELINGLPELFKAFGIGEDEPFPSDEIITAMQKQCKDEFFPDYANMIPPYDEQDVERILKYYAQYRLMPEFYAVSDSDREKQDITTIAQHILDEDMTQTEKNKYLEAIWSADDRNALRQSCNDDFDWFDQLVDLDVRRLVREKRKNDRVSAEAFAGSELHLQMGSVPNDIEHAELQLPCDFSEVLQAMKIAGQEISFDGRCNSSVKDLVLERAWRNGEYRCSRCGRSSRDKSFFVLDCVRPIADGEIDNLGNWQLLCSYCSVDKGSKKLNFSQGLNPNPDHVFGEGFAEIDERHKNIRKGDGSFMAAKARQIEEKAAKAGKSKPSKAKQ